MKVGTLRFAHPTLIEATLFELWRGGAGTMDATAWVVFAQAPPAPLYATGPSL